MNIRDGEDVRALSKPLMPGDIKAKSAEYAIIQSSMPDLVSSNHRDSFSETVHRQGPCSSKGERIPFLNDHTQEHECRENTRAVAATGDCKRGE